MTQEIKVGDIMTRDFIAVKPEASVADCAKLMIQKKVGSLIIRDNGKLKGLLTERDIIWAMTKKSSRELKKIKAIDIAKRKVVTIKPDSGINEALTKMKKSKYRWLPVIVNSSVVGFLTLKDILNVEPGLFELAKAYGAFQIREEQDKLKRREIRAKTGYQEGLCEECGNYDFLNNIDGRLICLDCKDEM